MNIRKLLGPLLANHALILIGAFFLVSGLHRGLATWESIGVALASAGIAIEVAVLAWAAALIRDRARRAMTPGADGRVAASNPRRVLCLSCGWAGLLRLPALCPRCGRPTVRTDWRSP